MSELPHGWTVAPLNIVAENLDSQRVPINATERAKRIGDVPYYGATGQVGTINDHIFNEELVLLGEDGAPFLERNKAKAYLIDGPAWVNNHAHVLRGRAVTNRYLLHYLNHFNYLGYANGTTRLKLTQAQMNRIPILVPPLAEQERIVASIEEQFSRLDAGGSAVRRAQLNLRRLKASTLQSAILGRGRDHELSPEELPPSWQWVSLESVLAEDKGAFRRGPFGSALTKASFVESGYKVYEQYCPINDDCTYGRYFISAERYEELKAFAVKAGDFLVSCSGTLGRITQVPQEFEEGVINQALLRIRTNRNVVMDDYFLAVFRSPYFQAQLLANSTGTAMVNVKGVKELKAISIPLPPLDEQARILGYLAECEPFMLRLENSLLTLTSSSDALRSSILASAFSGQLVQQLPSDEPAAMQLRWVSGGGQTDDRTVYETRTSQRKVPS